MVTWLVDSEVSDPPADVITAEDAQRWLFSVADPVTDLFTTPANRISAAVLGLVHSFAHRAMKALAARCGLNVDPLGEFLFPSNCAFLIHANTRSEFILGGPEHVFRYDLPDALTELDAESRWQLVLTVPPFLRGPLAELVAAHGDAARPRETSQVLAEVAASAQARLVLAAPYLHTRFVAALVPAVRRLLGAGEEVLVVTRALSLRAPERSSANVEAVGLLRDAGTCTGREVTVRSWEESGLGIHFKC